MSGLYYFAYGSNMSSKRLGQRIPSAKRIGMGVLGGHRLVFHKASTIDGSAKCDVIASPPDRVFGVLFEIEKAEKPLLDRFEGLGSGYDEKTVDIVLQGNAGVRAFTYFATRIDPGLQPFTWYLHHVLQGAREAGLPAAYRAHLEETNAIRDPDRERELRELAIYD